MEPPPAVVSGESVVRSCGDAVVSGGAEAMSGDAPAKAKTGGLSARGLADSVVIAAAAVAMAPSSRATWCLEPRHVGMEVGREQNNGAGGVKESQVKHQTTKSEERRRPWDNGALPWLRLSCAASAHEGPPRRRCNHTSCDSCHRHRITNNNTATPPSKSSGCGQQSGEGEAAGAAHHRSTHMTSATGTLFSEARSEAPLLVAQTASATAPLHTCCISRMLALGAPPPPTQRRARPARNNAFCSSPRATPGRRNLTKPDVDPAETTRSNT